MAPTEAKIYSNFLLPPASLPSSNSLKDFTALFPRKDQSSPQIRILYRDLQHLRARLTDAVANEIDVEVKKGNRQRRAVLKSRRNDGRVEDDDEAAIEAAVSLYPLDQQWGWSQTRL